MKKTAYLFLVISFCAACQSPKSAKEIVKETIEVHGGTAYDTANIQYAFRDKTYTLSHENGRFTYSRLFTDSLNNHYKDVLDNSGFKRYINDSLVDLPSKDSSAYANSVNSVHYFALLPHGLDAPAVKLTKQGQQIIDGQSYHSIQVTFEKQGGGTDYEDIFMYWINTDTNQIDFLAYSYHTNGGGVRFRKAYNKRIVKGILFQDYENYKAPTSAALKDLTTLYMDNQLELLSVIELENIK